mmetsp:Transcript_10421/g.44345  ORF Transcript_10421/g.44345 Transcript_10421/m.44345 type:complete len:203 (+) Transcript_10421:2037-2645(+)
MDVIIAVNSSYWRIRLVNGFKEPATFGPWSCSSSESASDSASASARIAATASSSSFFAAAAFSASARARAASAAASADARFAASFSSAFICSFVKESPFNRSSKCGGSFPTETSMSVAICASALFRRVGNVARGTAPSKKRHPGTNTFGELIMKNRTICTNAVINGFRHENTASIAWTISSPSPTTHCKRAMEVWMTRALNS